MDYIYPIFERDSYTKHIRLKFYDLKERMDVAFDRSRAAKGDWTWSSHGLSWRTVAISAVFSALESFAVPRPVEWIWMVPLGKCSNITTSLLSFCSSDFHTSTSWLLERRIRTYPHCQMWWESRWFHHSTTSFTTTSQPLDQSLGCQSV